MIPTLANLLRKISAASLLLLASQAILFLTMQLNADRLGPIGYGRFALAMSISVYAAQFIQWGMDQYLAAKFVRGTPEESRRLLGLLLRQKQLAGIIVLIVAAAAVLLKLQAEREMVILGAIDGIILGFTIPSVFDARSKTATWQFFAFLRHAAYVGSVLFVAYFFSNYYSPLAVLGLHALAIVLEVVLEQLWIQTHYGLPQWPVPIREALPLWKDAAPMALAMLAQQVLFFIGPPAMEFFNRAGETGALYVSNQFSIAAASFIAAPAALIHAQLAAHKGTRADFQKKVWFATLAFAIAGVAYALAFDIAAGRIAMMFFKKYPATPGIIATDAWRLAPIFAAAPFASAMICRGRLRAFAAAHVLSLLVGIVVAAIFIPRYGAQAAAGAVVAGRVALLILCMFFFLFDHASERRAR